MSSGGANATGKTALTVDGWQEDDGVEARQDGTNKRRRRLSLALSALIVPRSPLISGLSIRVAFSPLFTRLHVALLFPQNASRLLGTYNVVLLIELAVLYCTLFGSMVQFALSSRSGVTSEPWAPRARSRNVTHPSSG